MALKLLLATVAALACLATGSVASQTDSDSKITLALAGGRLLDGYGGRPLENAILLIAGERIAAIGSEGLLDIPANVPVIDTNGMTVLPGLWESHGHLYHVGEANPGAFQAQFHEEMNSIGEAVARVTVQAGVTSLRDFCTNCAARAEGWRSDLHVQQMELRKKILAGTIPGPRLYLSGPILSQAASTQTARGNFSIRTVAEAKAATQKLIEMGVDNIFVGAEIWDAELLSAIVEIAHGAGIGVDAESRHIRATEVLLQAGVDRIHVLFTAEALADHSDEELRALIRGVRPQASGPSANILRGPWYLSTLPMRQAYVYANRFPEVVEHPKFREMFSPEVYEDLRRNWQHLQSIPWGLGAEQRLPIAKQKLARFIEAGGREQLIASTDVGAPLNFHTPIRLQLRNFVDAGLTPMEAIQSATLRAAQMQGVADQVGTITPGKYADIIVVDGDPLQDIAVLQHRVVKVVMNGRVVK